MKYLKDFKLFENNLDIIERWERLDYESKIGKLLHLYGPIPTSRIYAPKVIQLVLNKYKKKYNILTDKNLIIDFNNKTEWDVSNSLRFSTYFNSLIQNKSTMGFNYEGTIAGFFNGELPDKDYRYDLTIDDKCYSIKTSVISGGDSIVIGSFKDIILKNQDFFSEKYNVNIIDEISKSNGIGYFFTDFYNENLSSSEIKSLKYDLLHFMFSIKTEKIVPNKVDYIVASFVDVNEPTQVEPSYIDNYVIDINDFIDYLIMKGGISPKTKTNIFQLRVSKNIIHESINKITFKFRTPNEKEIDELRDVDSLKWASKVFKGDTLSKMRPDVVKDIYNDRHNIVKKLLKKYVSF